MKILVLGAGVVGEAIVHDLDQDHKVSVGDVDAAKLKKVKDYAKTFVLDIRNKDKVLSKMEEHDVVIGALPGDLGFKTIKLAIESGTDIVDVSFMPEDLLHLDEEAEKKGVTVLIDAGFGPGMSNVFAGRIAEEIGDLKSLKIWIGSLPQEPQPPLYYKLTWSPKDLIEEYTRPARIIVDGEEMEIDPLNDIEKDIHLNDRRFEGFYSDGLRTLLDTIEVENMDEITLRWKGHLEKIKVLRELDFFEEENLDYTLEVIKNKMDYDSPDFSLMEVVGKGIDDEKEKMIRYQFYDEETENFSSIARTTGFSTAVMTRLLIDKGLEDGVNPPEDLGRDEELFDFLVEELRKRNIQVEEKISSI
ncbi:MAG: saccharopine dehydrogenase NADP-binding domain-containing protein [Candidatus Thermoplasmatota archaeon]|nr:saccharopine dehydrogenase NADP-binding domain-containing protein [Candidatus Thermoplasmatota archaeon]